MLLVWILGDQPALHGELKDGLPNRLQILGVSYDLAPMGQKPAPSSLNIIVRLGARHRVERRGSRCATCSSCPFLARFKLVAEGHQFLDLGDDPALLGEGRNGNEHRVELILVHLWHRDPIIAIGDLL